jgi:hypothetical protein
MRRRGGGGRGDNRKDGRTDRRGFDAKGDMPKMGKASDASSSSLEDNF